MPTLYFEDFSEGQIFDLGSRPIERNHIIEFATQYDPQPFHTDEAAAKASIYGGLIASGWQTGSIYMRLLFDGVLADTVGMGSPGVDQLRWLAPVRPGDVLSGILTIESTCESRSKPDRGLIMTRGELVNQDGTTVLSLTAPLMVRRRPKDPA